MSTSVRTTVTMPLAGSAPMRPISEPIDVPIRGTVGSYGTPFDPTSAESVSAEHQAQVDPPQAAGSDGWTPARVTAVPSQNSETFVNTAVGFALGGVEELPGQRLSTAQVDALAPYYSSVFKVDESWVRAELGKVYFYTGGPAASSGQAMTVGHHVFMPSASSLDKILSPSGKRWLVHELAHTMQYAVYDGSSSHAFLSRYIRGIVGGRDPQEPGSGTGPLVWGALFTGFETSRNGYETLGREATTTRQRIGFSLAPAALTGIPLALLGGGALSAARGVMRRATPELAQKVNLLGHMKALPTGIGLIALPMVAGSLAGVYADKIGSGQSQAIGAAAGGLLGAGTLLLAGAFTRNPGVVNLPRTTGLAIAAAAVAGSALLGWGTAHMSANTIQGWSRSADLLHEHLDRTGTSPSLQDGLHDAHWYEIDAEAIAQEYVHDQSPAVGPEAYEGIVPGGPSSLKARVDWGLRIPLTIGIPAAAVAGVGVMAGRTGHTLLKSSIRDGKGPMQAVRAAITELRGTRRGYLNSLSVGAALTVAPLAIGGIVSPIAANLGLGSTGSRIAGAGTAAVASGVLLTMLLGGRGSGILATTPKVLAGMAVAGAVGLLGASVAYDATHPQPRTYDIGGGTSANPTG